MDRETFFRLLHAYPVSAAIKSDAEQEFALHSQVRLLFLLRGDAFALRDFILHAHQFNKGVVVHLDLISGIGKDRAGIQYLKELGVDAIITSKSHLVAAGKAEKLVTIQRLILLESSAIEAGIRAIARAQPDIVEVLPGIIFPEVSPLLRQRLTIPLICGGFIQDRSDVEQILAAGALLCSSSTQKLWSQPFS